MCHQNQVQLNVAGNSQVVRMFERSAAARSALQGRVRGVGSGG